MFPLGSVLLPGMALPLRVFEPRYRTMLEALVETPEPTFGVVLIERGSEVGGGETRTDVGCAAVIANASRHADGTWSVLAVGTERLQVLEWLPDAPYPRAIVERWPDPPEAPPTTDGSADNEPDERSPDPLVGLEQRARQVAALAVELGARGELPDAELSADPSLRLYQLATLSPLGALDRLRILGTPLRSQRIALLDELLADQELLLRARLGFGD
jgi:uncharacterized protein